MVPLSTLIADFLTRKGMENECESWRNTPSMLDVYSCIMDGDVWKNLVGPDGRGFFEPCEDNELRIATTASQDCMTGRLFSKPLLRRILIYCCELGHGVEISYRKYVVVNYDTWAA
ncbi:hypothetical protein K439DRAFT_1619159 [Ramaria rubella]|nr:hypothetical protein K439DRAFT_1619159 [Ramaria rubella]